MNRRGALILGVAGVASAMGGLPAARPDQLTFPPAGGQQIPGPRVPVVRRIIISGSGAFVGLFSYSPTVGKGHLVGSAGVATPGTDPFGNAYLAGHTSYQPGATYIASQVNAGTFKFWTAPGFGGPWTAGPSISLSGGAMLLQAPASTINALEQILAEGGIDITAGGLAVNGGETTDTLTVTGQVNAPLAVAGAILAGLLLTVTNTTAGATSELARYVVAAAGDGWHGFRVAGDAANRLILDTTVGGLTRIRLGGGAVAPDAAIERLAANTLGIITADLAIDNAGRGLQVKEGANAKQGTATLDGTGNATVATTAVTANSRIFISMQDNPAVGTPGFLRVSARVVGTSFSVISSSNTDASTFAWEIFEPAP